MNPGWVREDAAMRAGLASCLVLCAGLAACSPATTTVGPSVGGGTAGAPAATAVATQLPAGSIAPTAAVGFAFDAESIVGYYQSIGYACTDPRPSKQAAGYLYRSCKLLDPDGRTRVVGLVTDASDDLADAYASVTGKPGEAVLDPTAALEPLAAFLGATLGPSQGEALLPWLASHLGDAYTKTTLADLTVATYTVNPDDHSQLAVELASKSFLDAPGPGASPS